MDAKEKAAYLLDKGYIINEHPNSLFELSYKIEAQAETADLPVTTNISSPATIIDYTHAHFLKGIEKIAQQIRDDNWHPDYIVGVVRGGAVPAVYLSHKLKIPVQMVRWNTRDKTELDNESNCWIPEDILAGKNVLIVEDIIDSGETIRELIADWKSSVRDELPLDFIRVAAMVYNISQNVKVDYSDIAIDIEVEKRWFMFPWEG